MRSAQALVAPALLAGSITGCEDVGAAALLVRTEQAGPKVNFAMDESDSEAAFSLNASTEVYADGNAVFAPAENNRRNSTLAIRAARRCISGTPTST